MVVNTNDKIMLFQLPSICTSHSVWRKSINFHHWSTTTIIHTVGTDTMEHSIKLKSTISWDRTLCSPLNVNRRFGGTYRLHLRGRRIGLARNQRESRWQAETSVDFQRTTWRYIPEDSTLHNHHCENLKSYIQHNWVLWELKHIL
jgi:hypothetical protein